MPRDLVTGSSGVLGHCLVTRLHERGRPLRLFDILPPPAGLASHADEVVQGDMRDPAALRASMRGVGVVYHLAAGQRMKPQFATMSEDEIRDMNVAGVGNVLAAARDEGVRKVVVISSSGVYGVPTTVPVSEDHPQRPLGAYGYS